MPSGAFNICCPRDCVSRHNGGTSGAPLKPLRVDSALRSASVWGFAYPRALYYHVNSTPLGTSTLPNFPRGGASQQQGG